MTIKQINKLILRLAKKHRVIVKLIKATYLSKYAAFINGHHNPVIFEYNINIMTHYKYSELLHTVLHELKHIRDVKNKHDFTPEQREYRAERYALNTLKKYHIQYYKKQIQIWKKVISSRSWQKRYPLHFKVYKKIKEYK